MKEICKNSEISSFLDAAWHDTIKETPNKDGALCIVCDGVDENGKDTYDLFTWDEKMKAFDTVVGRYVDEDLKNKHVLISAEGCFKWCYLENLLPEPKKIGECTEEDEEEPTERFEVRKNIVQILGLPSTKDECNRFEEAFDWVMNGKKVDRGGKLFCLEYARKHERRNYANASALSMAKCIFDVLL